MNEIPDLKKKKGEERHCAPQGGRKEHKEKSTKALDQLAHNTKGNERRDFRMSYQKIMVALSLYNGK